MIMPKRIKAPNVVRKWKKFLACGCSHGLLANPTALNAVVDFREDYNPDKVIHLGDFVDTAAWRSGAKGGPDEGACVADDVNAGLVFLDRLMPHVVFNGNHEIRIWKHAMKPSAIVAQAAAQTIYSLRDFIKGELKAEYIESYDLETSWRQMGNFVIGHGYFHNSHATKKHADKMGNCIFVHLHRIEVVRGDRSDRPVGVCAGFLGDRSKFGYADTWESKFRWGNGWVYGEYTDNECIWQIHHHVDKQSEPKRFQSV